MSDAPHDPRSISNLLLDEADHINIKVTNLALQKLLYFSHGLFLNETKKPLVTGYFEAWQYGPVHPIAYRAFRAAGSEDIRFRASAQDPLTGEARPLARLSNPDLIRLTRRVLDSFGRLSAGRLVDLSHAKNSPWDVIAQKGRTSVAFGLRIPDNVILERFKHHKVSVGTETNAGDPGEDTPLT